MLNSVLAATGLFQNQGISLYLAVRQGNLVEAINILNSIRAPYLKDVCNEQGRPVHNLLEIASPHKDIVRLLLEVFPCGADGGFSKENVIEAFEWSVTCNFKDTVRFLMGFPDLLKTSSIIECFVKSAERGKDKDFLFILETFANIINSENISEALCAASSNGRINFVRLCFKRFGDEFVDKYINRILGAAANFGQVEIVDWLLQEYRDKFTSDVISEIISAAIEFKDNHHAVNSLLRHETKGHGQFLNKAASHGHSSIARVILNEYSDTLQDKDRINALLSAIRTGQFSTIHLFLNNPSVVSLAHCNDNLAIRVARDCYQRQGHEPRKAIEYGQVVFKLLEIQIVALLEAAVEGNLKQIIARLSTAESELSDAHKILLYEAAIKNKHFQIKSYMIEKYPTALPIIDVVRAFVDAASKNQHEFVGAVFNQMGDRLLPYARAGAFNCASASGALETVKLLHQLYDSEPDADCYSKAFVRSAENGQNEILRFLFEHCLNEIILGQSYDDSRGWALRYASGYSYGGFSNMNRDHYQTVELLLDLCGDDISADFKRQALYDARCCGNAQTVTVLLTRCGNEMGLSVIKDEQKVEQNRSRVRP